MQGGAAVGDLLHWHGAVNLGDPSDGALPDRLKTSRSIRSWATSARNCFSSATLSLNSSPLPSRAWPALVTQLPNVPSLIPRSRAATAIGFASRGYAQPHPGTQHRPSFAFQASLLLIADNSMKKGGNLRGP